MGYNVVIMSHKKDLRLYKNYTWIVKDERMLWGSPSIRGTRLHVSQILECLSAGMTPEEIEEDYPGFPKESVSEVLRFAAEIVKDGNVAA